MIGNMRAIKILSLILICFCSEAQIKIVVSTPKLLMPNKPIYMASNLNKWNPNDEKYILKKQSDGVFFIELDDTLSFFEYKFTQGSWNSVEADENHNMLPNRIYIKKQEKNPKLIFATIKGWEKRAEYSFHIIKIPENTPHDASIYIAGTFNNWLENDENYKCERQFDGTFKIKFYTSLEEIQYKFNRGNWNSAESWKSGKARPNRTIAAKDIDVNTDIEVEIENWEDLTATFNYFSIFDLLLLFAAFQGLLLSVAIPTIQDFNREANKWLVLLIGFASLMMFIRVISNFRDVANAMPKLLLVPNFILFTYAPLLYLYIQRLLFQKQFTIKDSWRHFIPFGIQILIFLPYFFLESKKFQLKVVNDELDLILVYAITCGFALIFNVVYLNLSRKAINIYKGIYINQTAYHQNINYLSAVQVIQAICIILGFFTAVLFCVQFFGHQNIAEITEKSLNFIWIVFSMLGYFLGYYAIHQPEIFKLSSEDLPFELEKSIETPKIEENIQIANLNTKGKTTLADENIEQYKEMLTRYFEDDRPYINPNLSLNDLSSHLKIPSHIISKVINDGFDKNFFDFVNSYRIEEFKNRINDVKYRNYTLLSIAFDVGFNSKTAFNRSFKKITNQTPSEYYYSRKV